MRYPRRQTRYRRRFWQKWWAPGLPVLVLVALYLGRDFLPDLSTFGLTGKSSGACDIKGNISVRTGERIYHVRGGRYYDSTNIDESKGERWFCSEAEAHAAGWRRSYR